MNDSLTDPPDYDVTPALKAFLRAELEMVMSFEAPDGSKWNNLSVARAINESADIAGRISDDTITRFRTPGHKQQIRKPALMAIAEFLVRSEFITRADVDHYSKPDYSRAAASLSQIFHAAGDAAGPELRPSLTGEYRHYQRYRHNRLLETRLVIASPDDGASLTVSSQRSVTRLDELDWLLDETDGLHPQHYARIPELIDISDTVSEAQFLSRGAGIATAHIVTFLLGDEEQIDHGVINISDVSFDADHRINGLKGTRTGIWAKSVGGKIDTDRQTGTGRPAFADLFDRLILYPQGRHLTAMPVFGVAPDGAAEPDAARDDLRFQDTSGKNMSAKERLFMQAENDDLAIDLVLADCPDATARLAAAMNLLCVDHAIAAVRDGAAINGEHRGTGLPFIHTAAALGMRPLADVMIDSGTCDLTVRDRFNRLASTCADHCAEDFALRDKLIAAQIAQFRDKGIDPRRPTVPGFGSYRLARVND